MDVKETKTMNIFKLLLMWISKSINEKRVFGWNCIATIKWIGGAIAEVLILTL